MKVWDSIKCWADAAPNRRSIVPLSYRSLRNAIASCCESLPEIEGKRVALFMGNRALWGIYDIALTLKGAVVVPVPTFFSAGQAEHIIKDAGIELAIIESREFASTKGLSEVFNGLQIIEADQSLEKDECEERDCRNIGQSYNGPLDTDRVAKIIYTSGTTGNPKGVMIKLSAMEAVTKSLIDRSGANMSDRHLSLLPLSTLVETIGGLYAPLTAGSSIWYPASSSPEDILFNPQGLAKCLADVAPTTLNLVPSLLGAIIGSVNSGGKIPGSLRFVAIGGAPLHPALSARAGELNIPLHEGYGLSECSSVVALNEKGTGKEGSVGRILDHAKVEISDEGEIIVYGKGVMAGYTNSSIKSPEKIETGDLGYIDEEGYLFITGRKDNLILTSQGRNVSPEWVESVLLTSPAIGQVMVYGNGEGRVSAVIVPQARWFQEQVEGFKLQGEGKELTDHAKLIEAMFRQVEEASAQLPGYAKVQDIRISHEPFSIMNGLMGGDGRMMRKNILQFVANAVKVDKAGFEDKTSFKNMENGGLTPP